MIENGDYTKFIYFEKITAHNKSYTTFLTIDWDFAVFADV